MVKLNLAFAPKRRHLSLVLIFTLLITTIVTLGNPQNAYAVDSNLALGKTVVADSYYNSTVPPWKAVDGSSSTKWTSGSGAAPHWVRIDLGQVCNISRWVTKHAQAGGESSNYNTRDYKLQVSDNGLFFKDVDIVMGNTASSTDRNVSVKGRFVKLYITTPTQPGYDSIARIYELEVWGSSTTQPAMNDARPSGDAIKLDVTNNSTVGTHYYYNKFATKQYTFQTGDYIEYDVRLLTYVSGAGGIDIINSDNTTFRDASGWQDQNSVSGHPTADLTSYANNKWYHRKLAVPSSMIGKTSAKWDLAGANSTAGQSYSAYYDNILVTDGNGTIRRIIYRSSTDIDVNAVDISQNATASMSEIQINDDNFHDRNNLMNFTDDAYLPGDVMIFRVVNTSSGSHYFYNKFSNSSYTFQLGDYIEYDVKTENISGAGGIDIINLDGTCFRDQTGWQDQNGIGGHPSNNISGYAYKKWYHRKLAVPSSMVGKIAARWDVAGSNSTDYGIYTTLYSNIIVTNGAGTIKKFLFASAADMNDNYADAWVAGASATCLTYVPNLNPQPSATPSPAVMSTTYTTKDIVIASFNVTNAPYSADNTGVNDATNAIQTAINDCSMTGGGVVFIPSGKYKLTSSIIVQPHVTLRGDWRDPDTTGSSYGTVIMANVKSGSERDHGLFRMKGSTGVRGITVYYPDQSASSPVSYPYTFEIMGDMGGNDAFMAQTIQDVTLLNSYRGICTGITSHEFYKDISYNVHEQHTIRNVKGTVLYNPIYIQDASDVGRIQQSKFNNSYWANALTGFNAPSRTTLDNWTRANGTGLKMGDAEWEPVMDLSLSDYLVGIDIMQGERITPCGSMYNVTVENCNKALKITELDYRVGYQFSNCTFKADKGTNPIAIEITDNVSSSTIFNSCTIGGGATNAVSLTGNTMASFNNCTFDNWTGTYALVASAGTLNIQGSTFTPQLTSSKKGINLQSGVSSATILGNSFTGTSTYLLDNSSTGDVKRQDTGYSFESHGVTSYPWKTSYPKPSNTNFYNVKNSPYNAKADGVTDDTNAIQSALNAASSAGGGTVYLPTGQYKVNTHLTVPANVELRGSDDVPHRGDKKGSVLYVIEGHNSSTFETDTAFITLNGSNAGVRGVTIYYPNQVNTSWTSIVKYPYGIRGNGSGVYAIDIAFVNAYCGVDFMTNRCDNHYLNSVNGCCLYSGIKVGGGSTEGWFEDCLINGTYWSRTDLPNYVYYDITNGGYDIFRIIFKFTRNYQTTFTIGNTENEHLLNNIVYGAKTAYYFTAQGSDGPNATGIACSADGSREVFRITDTGTTGVKLINGQACSTSIPEDNVDGTADLDVIHQSAGTFKAFNFLEMAGIDKAVRITGGTSVIQGAAFQSKMGYVAGGTAKWNGVLFKDTGTHITVDSGVTNSSFIGNIGGGTAFSYVNNAGSGALFENNIKR